MNEATNEFMKKLENLAKHAQATHNQSGNNDNNSGSQEGPIHINAE